MEALLVVVEAVIFPILQKIERLRNLGMLREPRIFRNRFGAVAVIEFAVENGGVPGFGAPVDGVLLHEPEDIFVAAGTRDRFLEGLRRDAEMLEHAPREPIGPITGKLTAGQGRSKLIDRARQKRDAAEFGTSRARVSVAEIESVHSALLAKESSSAHLRLAPVAEGPKPTEAAPG